MKLRNWMSQFIKPTLPTRQLSSQTAHFARDHMALDLASHRVDSYLSWEQRKTPSPQLISSPPPITHHPKQSAHIKGPAIPFKGFTTADTDTDSTDDSTSASDPFNVPSPHIVIATKSSGPIKNFYVLIDTLPPQKITVAAPTSGPPVTPPSINIGGQQQTQIDDEDDVLMGIMSSPSRSPVLVRRLDPPREYVATVGIVAKLGSEIPETLPIIPQKLPGPSTSHYQGTPWENNSCWLDSGEWEALYAISLHDRAFWQWDQGNAPLTCPLNSRIGDLR